MQHTYDPTTKRFKKAEAPTSSAKEPGVTIKVTGETLVKLTGFAKADKLLTNGSTTTDRAKKVLLVRAVKLYNDQAITEFIEAREALAS